MFLKNGVYPWVITVGSETARTFYSRPLNPFIRVNTDKLWILIHEAGSKGKKSTAWAIRGFLQWLEAELGCADFRETELVPLKGVDSLREGTLTQQDKRFVVSSKANPRLSRNWVEMNQLLFVKPLVILQLSRLAAQFAGCEPDVKTPIKSLLIILSFLTGVSQVQ